MVSRFARQGILLAGLTVAASGCRAVGPKSTFRQGGANTLAPTMSVQEAVSAINQNAQAVNSLQARTSISASLGGRRPFATALKGNMLMERERNFRLQLAALGVSVADIGSNDQGFWFWVKDNDRAIYTCKYDANGRIPSGVPITMQPDWIIEAMGLREISETDAASMTIRRGNDSIVDPRSGRTIPTDVLRGPWQSGSGESFHRVIVLNSATKRIARYALYGPDGKQMLAEASPEYEPPKGDDVGPAIPHRVRLRWVKEQIVLDVSLSQVDPNPSFDKNRAYSFAEPDMPGFERRDLAAMSGANGNAGQGQTQIRETRPVPDLRTRRGFDGAASQVRLGPPSPVGLDGAALPSGDSRSQQPYLPPLPPPSDDLIRDTVPTAPLDAGTASVASDSRLSRARTGVER
jgi:hypothetical protein